MASSGFQYIPGRTCYVILRDPNQDEQVWDNVNLVFEVYNPSNRANYAISATDQGDGFYQYAPNISLPRGNYDVVAWNQTGGSPSGSADLAVSEGTIGFNLTAGFIADQVQLGQGMIHGGAETGLFLSRTDGSNPLSIISQNATAVFINASGGFDGIDITADGIGLSIAATLNGMDISGAIGINVFGGSTAGVVMQGPSGLQVTGTSTHGVTFQATGATGVGLRLIGKGSDSGLSCTGGSSGRGASFTGGGSSPGASFTGGTAGSGITVTSGSIVGSGISISAPAGTGLSVIGASGGALFTGSNGSGPGVTMLGGTSGGSGLVVTRGSSGGDDFVLSNTDSPTLLALMQQAVLAELSVTTYSEPAGAPGVTVPLAEKLGRLYQVLRNELTVTGSAKSFFDDAGTLLWAKALSDNGTTYTEAEGI